MAGDNGQHAFNYLLNRLTSDTQYLLVIFIFLFERHVICWQNNCCSNFCGGILALQVLRLRTMDSFGILSSMYHSHNLLVLIYR